MDKKKIFVVVFFLAAMVAAGVGLKMYQADSEPVYEKMDYLHVLFQGEEISALYDDGQKLWVGLKDGLRTIHRETGEPLEVIDDSITLIYASEIGESFDGLVWCGHNDGVSAYTKSGEKVLTFSAPQIPEGRVNAVLPVEDGVWIGCMTGAAFLTKEGGQWQVERVLGTTNGLTEECVSIIRKNGDELWFGMYLCQNEGGLCILKGDEWTYLTMDDGLAHRYVNSLVFLDEDTCLAGVGHTLYGGLNLLKRTPEGWKVTRTWSSAEGLPGNKVRFLFCTRDGRMIITTEMDGMVICERPPDEGAEAITGLYLVQGNGLADNEVKCIAESDACLWLGCKTGLTRMDKT